MEDTGTEFTKAYIRTTLRKEIASSVAQFSIIKDIITRLGHVEAIQLSMDAREEDLIRDLGDKIGQSEKNMENLIE